MKKYYIKDSQFTDVQGWWTWTKDQPQTKKQIIKMFRQYADDDEIELPKNKKDFDFGFIQDIWNCEIIEVKGE